jgi:hypothetical protein
LLESRTGENAPLKLLRNATQSARRANCSRSARIRHL